MYRPFALLALAATLGVATPVGALTLYRLLAAPGPLPAVWLRLHGHLQVFGFAGVLIMGVAHHLIPRFAHRPVHRPAAAPWIFGLVLAGLAARIAAAILGGPAGDALWTGSGIAETLAFAIFAVWVTGGLRAVEPRFPSDWLMVTGSWWFAVALAGETFATIRAVAVGADPAMAPPVPGRYAMGLYGGVFGWVLGVAMRAVPMFITGRRAGRLGLPALVGVNGGVLLGVLAGIAPPTSPAPQILLGLAELGVAAGLLAGALAVGAWQPEPRGAVALYRDRIEARFFRFAFACAGLGMAGTLAGSVSRLAGSPVSGLLADATLHLLTVGFMVGMICAMGFRFVPVIEGVRLAMPVARSVAFWSLTLAVLLRTVEVGAGAFPGSLVHLAAVSGFLAWAALLAWGLAVGLTMLRGAAIRRRQDPTPRIRRVRCFWLRPGGRAGKSVAMAVLQSGQVRLQTRPARTPVSRPFSRAICPFTRTYRMPSGSRVGSS